MIIIVISIIIVVCIFSNHFDIPCIEKPVLFNAKVIMKDYWEGKKKGVFTSNIFDIPVARSYRVTFELESSKNITFIIPRKTYNELSIGSTGILKYTVGSEKFKNFTINEIMEKYKETSL